ncbi:MFS transporter [Microbispora sp. H10836]|uniref:MFS transporter n=1 Tax=Microbispora sp. H10836 TaxID=2729106 RepID=UPI001474CA8A|nr:MFS transporter [Microbispora sp. H10836]
MMSTYSDDARVDAPTPGSAAPRDSRRLLASTFLGTTIEWYDFLVYGFLAPVALDVLFFPKLSPLAGTVAAFGVFAVGFLARPLGGVVFGHLGDRFGRKPIMIWTMAVAGAATTAMGLLPTYATLGLAAPLTLVVLRFVQGFALGGESAAGPLLAAESAPGGRRGLFAAIVQSGAAGGSVLGAGVVLVVGLLPREILLSWGWRLPFLASALIFLVGLYMRVRVAESPAFTRAITARGTARLPIAIVLRSHKLATLRVLLTAIAESSIFYFTAIFGLSYITGTLQLSPVLPLLGIVIGNGLGVLTNPLFGWLSDRVGRRPLLVLAYVLGCIYVAALFFPLLRTADPALVVLAMAIPGAILQPMSLAVTGSFYPEQFDDARVRLSGVALGRQIGTVLGGGLLPVISAGLVAATGGLTASLSYYAVLCAFGIGAVLCSQESARSELP